MPRGFSAEQKAELSRRLRAPRWFVELGLSTPVRAWTGVGVKTALGNTWQGVGEFGVVDGVGGSRDPQGPGVSFGLAGLPAQSIPAGAISATRGVRYQGAGLSLYLGFATVGTADLPGDACMLVGDPVAVWTGLANVMAYQIGETVSCVLSGAHISTLLRRANGLRMTTQSHLQRLGNPAIPDLFFDYQDRTAGEPRQILR